MFVYKLSGCGFNSSCSHLKISDFAPALSKEFLDIQAPRECEFTLKRVRDMIRRYSHLMITIQTKNARYCLYLMIQLPI